MKKVTYYLIAIIVLIFIIICTMTSSSYSGIVKYNVSREIKRVEGIAMKIKPEMSYQEIQKQFGKDIWGKDYLVVQYTGNGVAVISAGSDKKFDNDYSIINEENNTPKITTLNDDIILIITFGTKNDIGWLRKLSKYSVHTYYEYFIDFIRSL